MRERVTNIIKIADIATWTPEHPVIIEAGTDTGKSYFIKSVLYQYAKERGEKILMLLHRANCVRQFQMEIEAAGKTDVITIMTYQKIEAHRGALDLSQYSYIVNDEFHYFISDAKFNVHTDISFRAIMNCSAAVKIFMSATGEDVEQYIRKIKVIEPIKYSIPEDYSGIATLTFFYNTETLKEIAEEVIAKDEKAIFFIENVYLAYDLYKEYEDRAIFNCSESNKKGHYRYVNEEKISQILKNERFEKNLLITTTCMDAGVNIVDEAVKTIVVAGVSDVGSLIQCIGRKRRQNETDKIFLYIKAFNNKQIGGAISKAKKDLAMAEYLRENGPELYLQKYYRDFDVTRTVYDAPIGDGTGTSIKKVNEMMYYKKRCDIAMYQQMISLGKYGYCRFLARKFGFYNAYTMEYSYRVRNENHELISYLESMVGKPMLQKKDRKELIEKMDVRSNGKVLKSLGTLNHVLHERNLPFCIEQYGEKKTVNGKRKRYTAIWEVRLHVWNEEGE